MTLQETPSHKFVNVTSVSYLGIHCMRRTILLAHHDFYIKHVEMTNLHILCCIPIVSRVWMTCAQWDSHNWAPNLPLHSRIWKYTLQSVMAMDIKWWIMVMHSWASCSSALLSLPSLSLIILQILPSRSRRPLVFRSDQKSHWVTVHSSVHSGSSPRLISL